MKASRSLKITGLILLFAGVILEIWLINRLSSMGGKFNQIKEAQAAIELENQVLENDISKMSSLATTQAKSSQLGFSASKQIEYLQPDTIASLR